MPCRNGWDDLRDDIISKFKVPIDYITDMYIELDKVTGFLCSILNDIENVNEKCKDLKIEQEFYMTPDLEKWWLKHKKWDKKGIGIE